MNKQVLRILEMHIHTHIHTCKRIFMYVAVCVCVCVCVWNFYSKNNFKILTCWLR